MSPWRIVGRWSGYGFPRVSGDEPMPRPAMEVLNGFSPRERG